MGNGHSSEKGSRREGRHRETNYRHRRYEGSDIPNSPTQRVHNDHLSYGAGGFCNICSMECESIANHVESRHKGLSSADYPAQVDREPVRPHYGKDMHPSNEAFSVRNTMTPCGFDEQQVPLSRQERGESASSSASRSATSSSTSHDAFFSKNNYPAGGYHTDEELAAGAWDNSGPSTPRQGSLQSEAPLSGFQSPPRGETARIYSQDFFQKFESRNTPDPFVNRPEGRSASQAARDQPAHNYTASSSTSASYPSTRSSISPPRPARLYHHPQVPAQPLDVPQNDRGRDRVRPGYPSPIPNSPRRSSSRSHRDREPSNNKHARAGEYPPRTSENMKQWKEHRREPSRTRISPQAQAEGSRGARYDNVGARGQQMRSEDYQAPPRTDRRGEHSRVRMPQKGETGPSRGSIYDEVGAREQYTTDDYVNPPRDERRREPSRTRIPPGRQSEARPPRSTIDDELDAREEYIGYDYGSPPRSERRREPSQIRMSQQAESGPPRKTRYDDFGAGEQYRGRDGYQAHSRREPSPPGRRYARPPERVVFPGDETLFSRSYLREMGDLRLGGSRRYVGREDDGKYYEEYDSDDHMYSPDYLRDMTRTRGWRGNP